MAHIATNDSAILIAAALLALGEATRARHALRRDTPAYAAAVDIERFRIAEVWRLADLPT